MGASFNNPLYITTSISSAIVNAKQNGMVLALRQNSFGDGFMYFNCNYLSYFGYNNTSLICGGYRKLMINNIRTVQNKVNYERFIKPISFLDHFLNEMAGFYIEPKVSDYKMLNVLINEPKRCPVYVKQLFEAFVDKQTNIRINMRILKKYYAKLLEKMLITKECDQLIAISFVCQLFQNCNIIEIEMEASMNGDVQELSQNFIKALLSEMEHIEPDKVKLKEIKIYQIEIAKNNMLQLNDKLNDFKWSAAEIIIAKNKENKNYFGKSICIQKT